MEHRLYIGTFTVEYEPLLSGQFNLTLLNKSKKKKKHKSFGYTKNTSKYVMLINQIWRFKFNTQKYERSMKTFLYQL